MQNDPVGHVDLWGLTASDSSYITFPIRSGQTLSQITNDHNYRYATNYTAEEIAALNGISNPDLIYAGDTLKLPVPTLQTAISISRENLQKNYDSIKDEPNDRSTLLSDHSVSVAMKSQNNASAFYAGAGANLDIENGNFNVNANAGVAQYNGPITRINNYLELEGNASGIGVDAMIGLQGSFVGYSLDAHIFKGGGSLSLSMFNKKIIIGGEVMLGGIGSSCLLSKKGIKVAIDFGIGGGLQITWEDEENEY